MHSYSDDVERDVTWNGLWTLSLLLITFNNIFPRLCEALCYTEQMKQGLLHILRTVTIATQCFHNLSVASPVNLMVWYSDVSSKRSNSHASINAKPRNDSVPDASPGNYLSEDSAVSMV